MVKERILVEVNFPDCAVCGEGILGGHKFFEFQLTAWLLREQNAGGGSGVRGRTVKIPVHANCVAPNLISKANLNEVALALARELNDTKTGW